MPLPPDQDPILVIGSGITGLLIALELAEGGRSVQLISKGPLSESNTRYAQGGMAVALGAGDSPDQHLADTLAAGSGLCDEAAVAVLTQEAPARFADLLSRGVAFDREEGTIALTLEGAHSHRRVVHAQGDATGAEIERALVAQVRANPAIGVHEHAFVYDLILLDGRVCGARIIGSNELASQVVDFPAAAVVLAAGGVGRVYRHTTNPAVATGDGVAMAYRAGAAVRDMEFIQFHPTAFRLADGSTFLISEAVRGEGAVLRNQAGEAFMTGVHPGADLAPRDVVARAIAGQMAAEGTDHVWLDLRHLASEQVAHRFPTISRICAEQGIQLPGAMIPVAPAAHYSCGGIVTDLVGCTSLPGLFAAGEVACTGVHGANRLASNSLLECVVFGHRLAQALLDSTPPTHKLLRATSATARPELPPSLQALRQELPRLMWENVGLLRDRQGLETMLGHLATWHLLFQGLEPGIARGELRNMITTGELITRAAMWREESRGCHYRLDHPSTDAGWRRHLTQQTGALSV